MDSTLKPEPVLLFVIDECGQHIVGSFEDAARRGPARRPSGNGVHLPSRDIARLSSGNEADPGCPRDAHGGDWYEVVEPGRLKPAGVGRAMTKLLNARKRSLFETTGGRRPEPLVLFVTSACGLSESLDDTRAVCEEARRELRRSGLPETIGLVVYLGGMNGRLPDDATLHLLDDIKDFDLKICVSDCNSRGDRIEYEDATVLAGRALYHSLATPDVLTSLLLGGERGQRLSIGYGRFDISAARQKSRARDELRRLLSLQLFKAEPGRSPVPPLTDGPITSDLVNSLIGAAEGDLRSVEQAVVPAIRTTTAQFHNKALQCRMDHTYRSLAIWLQKPSVPVPRRRWWEILIDWMRAIIALLTFGWLGRNGRRRPGERTAKAQASGQSRAESSERAPFEDLCKAEQLRARLMVLQLALLPSEQASEADRPLNEVPLVEAPHVRESRRDRLSDIATLTQDLLGDLRCWLAEDEFDAKSLRDRIDKRLDEAIDLKTPTLTVKECREAVLSMASNICAPVPLRGRQMQRFLILPAQLCGKIDIPDFEPVRGRSDEVVLLVVAAGFNCAVLGDPEYDKGDGDDR